jgi:type II secretory pathway pseudopilin PulG
LNRLSIARLSRYLRAPQRIPWHSNPDQDPDAEAGFTILELMVAMAILMIMSAAILSLLLSAMRLQGMARARTIAAQVAEETLELARTTGVYSLQQIITYYGGQYEFAPIQEGPYTFYRRIDVSWEEVSGTSNPAPADYIRVTAEVTWNNMGTQPPVVMTTYVGGPPCATNTGFIEVSVVDHMYDPVPNVQLDLRTRTGLSWGMGFTSSEGKQIFACINAGYYEITGTLSGYIARDRTSKVIVPNISVAPKQVTSVQFQMARPASLSVRLVDSASGLELTGTGAVSIRNATFGPLVLRGNSPFSVSNLWPDTYTLVGSVYDCSGGSGFMSAVVGSFDRLLDPGPNSANIPLSSGLQVTVEVTVLGDNQAPVQDASISARDGCGTLNIFPVTNSQGVSLRSGILPGPYDMTVTPPPSYKQAQSGFIASADPTRMTVVVSR